MESYGCRNPHRKAVKRLDKAANKRTEPVFRRVLLGNGLLELCGVHLDGQRAADEVDTAFAGRGRRYDGIEVDETLCGPVRFGKSVVVHIRKVL